jgi:hypothetical protein
MTKKRAWLKILVIVLVFGMVVVGCDDNLNKNEKTPQTVKYESKDSVGNAYILTITENLNRAIYSAQPGDNFELKIIPPAGETKISRGIVQSANSNNLALKPDTGDSFSITLADGDMIGITGTITLVGGQIEAAFSGTLTPVGKTEEPFFTNGIFTLTNIPSKYNGKYAIVDAETLDDELFLAGAESIVSYTSLPLVVVGVCIENGSVNIPMWNLDIDNESSSEYNGNNNAEAEIWIYNSAITSPGNDPIACIDIINIKFINGGFSKSCTDGDVEIYEDF